MKAVIEMIGMFGGIDKFSNAKVENSGYMPLCIERIGVGPNGHPLVSVAHYYEQNGDLVADPEMTFEYVKHELLGDFMQPVSFAMPGMGIYRESQFRGEDGKVYVRPRELAEERSFARKWSGNLRHQGFLKAAKKMAKK